MIMRKCLIRLLRQQQGATVIEFALVAPLLFFLVFAIIEFSLVMFVSSAVESPTIIGSRYGITGNLYAEFAGDYNDDNGDGVPDNVSREAFIRSEVEQRTLGLLNPSRLHISAQSFGSLGELRTATNTANFDAGAANETVLYNVTYDWPLLTPLASTMFGQDGVVQITSSVVVVNEAF